jgi:hypothetical protein
MPNEFDANAYLAGLRRAATEGEDRQMRPERETRPQPEKERNPDYFQRRQESEGRSEWSGGRMGGGVWAGRDRH